MVSFFIPSFLSCLQLFHFRYQQAVITISAGVDYIDFPGIRIAEDKKGVSQQVHLQNGFFHRHWFYRESLNFCHLRIFFFIKRFISNRLHKSRGTGIFFEAWICCG